MMYKITVYLMKDMDPLEVCVVDDIPPRNVKEVFENMYNAWCSSILEYTILVEAFREVEGDA